MKKIFRRIALCIALQTCCAQVHAHAFLDRATPAVGSTLRRAPAEIKLWFTEELEPAFSTLRVLDKNGRQVDRMDKQVDHADATLLKVSVPPLAPGKYQVLWRALSTDAHVTEGDFAFEIAP